ncbi:SAM-dependent methyltransferase [Fusibacter paucivorans]|uniref:SAM-dependent methyltransferase n=1 Tax=Fusibacter paucivorans TaxID=76009 RepID=A0ABS5PS06_9FIRM|nr:SAM-dependent methyltransferase [Fusibacter paucivorans]MBS7527194.1 SAM-dependent methyltransferase [Fusibacter paucivorans]
MEHLNPKITEIMKEGLLRVVLSSVRRNVEAAYYKIDVKPILMKELRFFHACYYFDKKVTHENIPESEFVEWLTTMLGHQFKQGMLYTAENNYQILISKKGKATVIKQAATMKPAEVDFTHNRQKQYILNEGEPIDFLVHLGVMDDQGNVYKKKYDKFRQLNKYLEFVSDAVKELESSSNDVLTLIDFGCGKAYLTFALYYYLVKIRGKRVRIIGLDLKEDVIAFCNEVAMALAYDGLTFKVGDIKDYQYKGKVDMVVSLHACDTATDAAIGKAVAWDAKVIFAVPCCQHELFGQMQSDVLSPLLKHGIVKDKLATVVTDTLRAQALEVVGYDVQMLEFIDMTHTPKNILIRAYRQDGKREEDEIQMAAEDYLNLKNFWHVTPSIEKALGDRLINRL